MYKLLLLLVLLLSGCICSHESYYHYETIVVNDKTKPPTFTVQTVSTCATCGQVVGRSTKPWERRILDEARDGLRNFRRSIRVINPYRNEVVVMLDGQRASYLKGGDVLTVSLGLGTHHIELVDPHDDGYILRSYHECVKEDE